MKILNFLIHVYSIDSDFARENIWIPEYSYFLKITFAAPIWATLTPLSRQSMSLVTDIPGLAISD
jgi:hypothetical protein